MGGVMRISLPLCVLGLALVVTGHTPKGELKKHIDDLADLEQAIRSLSPTRDLEAKRGTLTGFLLGAGMGAFASVASDKDGTPGLAEVALTAGAGGLAGATAAFANDAVTVDKKHLLNPEQAMEEEPHGEIEFSSTTQVEFITDVAGRYDYFVTMIKNSKILNMDENHDIHVSPHGVLVLGGDMVGQGTGDIRIITALLDLKRRQPDKVYWVLGDKDISTLRYVSELNPSEVTAEAPIYWLDSVTPRTEWCIKEHLLRAASSEDLTEAADSNTPEEQAVCTTKWMQTVTMNAPDLFSDRRAELEQIRLLPIIKKLVSGDTTHGITEEHVVESFRNSVDPGWGFPWMLNYLSEGHIAVRMGDVLFVHGGVQALQRGYIPGGGYEPELSRWVEKLNAWKNSQLEEFSAQPRWMIAAATDMPVDRVRGGEFLMDYALPGQSFGRSVVTSNYATESGDMGGCDDIVEAWLLDQGIQRVITGGQEVGLTPAIVRRNGGVTVINANTKKVPIRPGQPAYTVVTISVTATSFQGKLPKITSCIGDACTEETAEFDLVPQGTPYGFSVHRNVANDERAEKLVGRLETLGSGDSPIKYWIEAVIPAESATKSKYDRVLATRKDPDGSRKYKLTVLDSQNYAQITSQLDSMYRV